MGRLASSGAGPGLRGAGRWLCAALAASLLACAEPAEPEPPLARMTAERTGLIALLERAASLTDTRLGRLAARLAAGLPDCRVLESTVPEPDFEALLAGLRCATPEEAHPQRRAGRMLAIVWPLEPHGTLQAHADVDASGSANVELLLPADAAWGAAGLLLPADRPPGRGVLDHTDTLVHARVRPLGGLSLADWVDGHGQAANLFRLKSAIFSGAVLDGVWEAAIYVPGPRDALPPTALAVGFRARAPAVAAMEQFLSDLNERWGVEREDFALGEATGACLPQLRILPELAPCYVATAGELVLGWNGASLGRALTRGGRRLDEQGGLEVAIARFQEADTRLAAAARMPLPPAGATAPWSRLRAAGRAERDGVRLHVELRAEPEA